MKPRDSLVIVTIFIGLLAMAIGLFEITRMLWNNPLGALALAIVIIALARLLTAPAPPPENTPARRPTDWRA